MTMDRADTAHRAANDGLAEPVFRLIYRSRSTIGPANLDGELAAILRTARARNVAEGITGALLLYDDWFAQSLEGPEGAVKALFDKIRRDARHDSVELREEGPVKARVFSRWSMALVGEHGEFDVPLIATSAGTSHGAPRRSSAEQEEVLVKMRDATRGYGRGA